MIANSRASRRLWLGNEAVLFAGLVIFSCSMTVTKAQDVVTNADVKVKSQQLLQSSPPAAEGRVAEYEREFQRQLNAQRAFSGAATLNQKVRQLQSRLKQQYPEGRSAEFQREFLRGLNVIQHELGELPNEKGRVAEYEREFQRQLNAQTAFSGAATLNEKVRQLQSRVKQQYPDGRSAEFRQEFLRGLNAIQHELGEPK